MVRFDSTLLLLEEMDLKSNSVKNAVLTIKYLYKSGAKVILASNWNINSTARHPDMESVPGTHSRMFPDFNIVHCYFILCVEFYNLPQTWDIMHDVECIRTWGDFLWFISCTLYPS